MKKLKLTTKPKRLTFREMYELYVENSKVTDAEISTKSNFIIRVLSLCYPRYNREGITGLMLCLLSDKALENNQFSEFVATVGGWENGQN